MWVTFLDKSDRLSHLSICCTTGQAIQACNPRARKSEIEMPATEDQRFERLEHLFGLFVRGQNDEFLAGCTDDLILNVRGSAGLATLVPRAQIAQWHQAKRNLAGGAFHSSVCFILATEHEGVVVLTHLIERNGVTYRYETVNHCTLRDDLLAAWFNLPMNTTDYARAWDLEPLSQRAALRS